MAYYKASQVIKMRRKAMGHSRYEYDADGPSNMAVYRMEEKGIRISEKGYRKLTRAMGEEESTRRGVLETRNIRVLWLTNEILYSLLKKDYEKAERLLEELRERLDCSVKRNQQYLVFLQAELQYKQKKITGLEYKTAIGQSISYGSYECENLLEKKWPFKEREYNSFQKMVEVVRKEKEYERQKKLLYQMKEILETGYMETEYTMAHLVYVRWRLGDVLGNLGQHREAVKLNEETIRLCTERMELRYLAHVYYDTFWNYQEIKKKETLTEQEEARCKECLLKAYYINKALYPENKLYEQRIRECYPEELV